MSYMRFCRRYLWDISAYSPHTGILTGTLNKRIFVSLECFDLLAPFAFPFVYRICCIPYLIKLSILVADHPSARVSEIHVEIGACDVAAHIGWRLGFSVFNFYLAGTKLVILARDHSEGVVGAKAV